MTAPRCPTGLAARGRRVWREFTAAHPGAGPGALLLLEEAARMADRLDRLDAMLAGDRREWLTVRVTGDYGTEDMKLIVDKLLSETRQSAVALKSIMAELRQAVAPTAAGRLAGADGREAGGSDSAGVDELEARRLARVSAARAAASSVPDQRGP